MTNLDPMIQRRLREPHLPSREASKEPRPMTDAEKATYQKVCAKCAELEAEIMALPDSTERTRSIQFMENVIEWAYKGLIL